MLRESCILLYRLIGIGIYGERIYNSRWKQCKYVFDKNKAIVDLEHRLGPASSNYLNVHSLYRQSHQIIGYQISSELPILVKTTYEAVSSVVALLGSHFPIQTPTV